MTKYLNGIHLTYSFVDQNYAMLFAMEVHAALITKEGNPSSRIRIGINREEVTIDFYDIRESDLQKIRILNERAAYLK